MQFLQPQTLLFPYQLLSGASFYICSLIPFDLIMIATETGTSMGNILLYVKLSVLSREMISEYQGRKTQFFSTFFPSTIRISEWKVVSRVQSRKSGSRDTTTLFVIPVSCLRCKDIIRGRLAFGATDTEREYLISSNLLYYNSNLAVEL